MSIFTQFRFFDPKWFYVDALGAPDSVGTPDSVGALETLETLDSLDSSDDSSLSAERETPCTLLKF